MTNIFENVINNTQIFNKAAWTPERVPGLLCWLDFADISTMTFNGSFVAQVNDKSGNNNNGVQGSAGNQLLFNATGCLSNTDDASRFLEIPTLNDLNFPQNTASILIGYRKRTAWTAGYRDFNQIQGRSGSNLKAIFFQKNNTDKLSYVVQNGSGFSTIYSFSTVFGSDKTCFGIGTNLDVSSSIIKTFVSSTKNNELSVTPNIFPSDIRPRVGGAITGDYFFYLIYNRYLTDIEFQTISQNLGCG